MIKIQYKKLGIIDEKLKMLFLWFRPFYKGGVDGNKAAPAPLQSPHLSWEERWKEEELMKVFDSLLTTPADMTGKHLNSFKKVKEELQRVSWVKEFLSGRKKNQIIIREGQEGYFFITLLLVI